MKATTCENEWEQVLITGEAKKGERFVTRNRERVGGGENERTERSEKVRGKIGLEYNVLLP